MPSNRILDAEYAALPPDHRLGVRANATHEMGDEQPATCREKPPNSSLDKRFVVARTAFAKSVKRSLQHLIRVQSRKFACPNSSKESASIGEICGST